MCFDYRHNFFMYCNLNENGNFKHKKREKRHQGKIIVIIFPITSIFKYNYGQLNIKYLFCFSHIYISTFSLN